MLRSNLSAIIIDASHGSRPLSPKKLGSHRPKIALRLCSSLVLLAFCARITSAQEIPFSQLNKCQSDIFGTLPTRPPAPPPTLWSSLDDSQRLEYAGGTQALSKAPVPPPPCAGLSQIPSVSTIWGSRPDLPSAEQFHLDVGWSTGARDAFKNLPGWGTHIALLHPGQFGFQENRDGNPFLGLVLLFDSENSEHGQFHIGFRSFFSHYRPDNGNIAKNYKKYCAWYGQIDGYSAICPTKAAAFPPPEGPFLAAASNNLKSFPSSDLKATVREFLNQWYVRQNLDLLVDRFLAADNSVRALSERGFLPDGTQKSFWSNIFAQAFETGIGTVRFQELPQAIVFKGADLPKSVAPLTFMNESPGSDGFAILVPNSPAEGSFLPPNEMKPERPDPVAQYLFRLKQQYRTKDPLQNRLSVVVYTTYGPGLLREGAVLYWIKESDTWKLAAFQGTD